MSFILKTVLLNGVFILAGIAVAWFIQPRAATDLNAMLAEHQQLLDDIAALEHIAVLPPLHQSWSRATRYVSLYDNVSLSLLETSPEDAAIPFTVANKKVLLTGAPLQIFTAARRLQQIVPMFFERFSLEAHQPQSAAKLVLYVIGRHTGEKSALDLEHEHELRADLGDGQESRTRLGTGLA